MDSLRGLLLVAAVLVAYWPALHGSFLWDDDGHVTKNALQSWAGLRRIWLELGATQQYYPLLHSAFWVEHRLWGDDVLGYHLVNVFLHSASAILLVLISRRLWANGPLEIPERAVFAPAGPLDRARRVDRAAWLAGFIFALHPVCVESVAWISEQKNTLSVSLGLGAALTYLHFRASRRKTQYLLASVLFVSALLSKTVVAIIPAALLVIAWWRDDWRGVRGWLLWLLPWIALGAAAGLFTAWVEKTYFVDAQVRLGPAESAYALSLAARCLLAARALAFYLGKLLVPVNLIFIYPRWQIDVGDLRQYWAPLSVVGGFFGLWVYARRSRAPLATALVYAGGLFPALGFFDVYPFRYSYVADHFQYLACTAVIVGGATLFSRLCCRPGFLGNPTLSVAVWSLAGAAVVSLGLATHLRCESYRTSEALYRDTLDRNPDCWLAHVNLGLILAGRQGEAEEALHHFQRAVLLAPQDAELHNQLGSALARRPGGRSAAIEEYRKALQLSPRFPYAWLNLAIAEYAGAEGAVTARPHVEEALRLKPDLAEAHHLLGYCLLNAPGEEQRALAEFRAAVKLAPANADFHTSLGLALAALPGHLADAVNEFRAAVALTPDSDAGYANLGTALQMSGHLGEARDAYRQALRLNPGNEQARLSLANLPP